MIDFIRRKRRPLMLVAVPVAGVVLLGGAGWAVAGGAGSASSTGDGAEATYHSSVTTATKGDGDEKDHEGSEAAEDLALAKLATIDLAQAARAGAAAVPGGSATSAELENEHGNVVYVVEVVSGAGETEVIIDAGNGHVLARQAEHDGDHASTKARERHESSDRSSTPATPRTGESTTSPQSSATP